MQKALVWARTIDDLAHNRTTTMLLRRTTVRDYFSECRKYRRIANSWATPHLPSPKLLLKLVFFQLILKNGQKTQSIIGTQKCDVLQPVSNQGIISQPHFISHRFCQAIHVSLLLGTVCKGQVDITCFVVAKISITPSPMLPAFKHLPTSDKQSTPYWVLHIQSRSPSRGTDWNRFSSRYGACTRTYSRTLNHLDGKKEDKTRAEVIKEGKNGKQKKNSERERYNERELWN